MNKQNNSEKNLYITKITDFITKEIQIGKKVIVIPKFQRQYCWNKKHFENFLNDILKNKSYYFLGTYIIYEEDKKLLVIDGQQRLITTLILLMILRVSYKKTKRLSISNTWVNNIVETMRREEEIIKFEYEYHNKCWNSIVKIFSGIYEENDFDIPEKEIKKITDKKDSISKCFSYFYKKLSDENDAKRDTVLNILKNIKFCIFKLNSEEEAILNFVKVNTIIQPLKKFDIFKGKIYEKCNDNESGKISKQLNKIQEKIKYDDLDKFLTFFVTCKKGIKISKSELDTKASDLITEKIESFVNELEKYSLIYTAFLDKSENAFEKEIPEQLKCSFYLIKYFGYKQIIPIFTIVFFKIKSLKVIEKNILNLLKDIMNKILVYMIYKQVIQREKGTVPRSFFNELIKKIYDLDLKNSDIHEEIKKIFSYIKKDDNYDSSTLEEYVTYKLKLDNKNSLNKKIIRWILFEYYSKLVDHNFLLKYKKDYDFLTAIIKNKEITIEHIIDEKINDVDKYLTNESGNIDINFKKYIEENNENINKIWNLTFLTSNLNNELGSDSKKNFFNKIKYYKTEDSSFLNKEININKIEKDIIQYDFLKDRKMKIIDFVTKKLFD